MVDKSSLIPPRWLHCPRKGQLLGGKGLFSVICLKFNSFNSNIAYNVFVGPDLLLL